MPGQFDIFRGSPESEPMWLEVVSGVGDAIARMEEHAKAKPGSYFVYDPDRHSVIASLDTVATCAGNLAARNRCGKDSSSGEKSPLSPF